jgi:ABC-type antimicrobial peptide transport system permease subunit
VHPDPSVLLFPWYIWWSLIIGTFLMTVIGTWLIARRWKE